jgi:hypothetical protein
MSRSFRATLSLMRQGVWSITDAESWLDNVIYDLSHPPPQQNPTPTQPPTLPLGSDNRQT